MTDEMAREQACGPIASDMVGVWIDALLPRITDRASMVQAMCHIMRRARGSSECHLCEGPCDDPKVHAASDLALAYSGMVTP